MLTRHANSLAGDEQASVAAAIDFLFNHSQLAGGEFSVLGNLVTTPGWSSPSPRCSALPGGRFSRRRGSGLPLSVLSASHSGIGAEVGPLALFVALLLRFGKWSREVAPSQAPEPA